MEAKKGAEHSGWHGSLIKIKAYLIADNASQWQQFDCCVCRRFAVKDTLKGALQNLTCQFVRGVYGFHALSVWHV